MTTALFYQSENRGEKKPQVRYQDIGVKLRGMPDLQATKSGNAVAQK